MEINDNTLNTYYKIDGFRSLRNFQIQLTPGLNVLVGPNGSGKTNFIDFLDFLYSILSFGTSDAVSDCGGIAKVFSVENRSSSPKMRACINGVADFSDVRGEPAERRLFNFEYILEIKFSKQHSTIFISEETLKVCRLRNYDEPHYADKVIGVISVKRRSPLEDSKSTWKIEKRLLAKNKNNPFNILPRLWALRYNKDDEKRGATDLLDRLQDYRLAPDDSFLTVHQIPALRAVLHALTKGSSFNIIPDKVRKPDDLVVSPEIRQNGAGLFSTLHMLQEAKKAKNRSRLHRYVSGYSKKVNSDSLKNVINWTRLVYPQLVDIVVQKDFHTGKYICNLVLEGNPPLKIPLNASSDGTLKWLALVCLITTSPHLYSLEEPENFLHPRMQQFLVALIRESLVDEARHNFYILSTHSETMINHFSPEELILFSFKDGATHCDRIAFPERVEEEINKTGFGLGHYYASNAIS